ncbi:MAG: hypothetical protein IJ533_01770 [Prevotella sp.]|nr:hypothetical protein [Prevotella sp.]
MKRILLTSLIVLGAMQIGAQPTPVEVVPGSKGALPVVPAPPTLTAGNVFVGLEVYSSLVQPEVIFNGRYYFHSAVTLNFPQASVLGGDYYTLQYRPEDSSAEWETLVDSDKNQEKFNTSAAMPRPPYAHTEFRLLMHGGPMDGYTSNVVTADAPDTTIPTNFRSSWSDASNMFNLVGVELNADFHYNVEVCDPTYGDTKGSYTEEDGYYKYQWYLRNPNTYEMKPIEGATAWTYTPVLADAGYEPILKITGDGEHCSFTQYVPHEKVCIPVQGYVSYYGSDGIILNTDYILPNPASTLGMANDLYSDTEPIFKTVTTKKAGQYALLGSEEEVESWNYGMLNFVNSAYQMIFAYKVSWDEDEPEQLWLREAQLMPDRYRQPLNVKVSFDGHPVAATIDVIGRNINDEWTVMKSVTLNGSETNGTTIENALYALGEGYYLKARATAITGVTYYPSATTMEGAKTVMPAGEYVYDEATGNYDLVVASATISLQPGKDDTATVSDANGDGLIDIVDATSAISCVLGQSPEKFSVGGADTNADGQVNIVDITTIISSILNNK